MTPSGLKYSPPCYQDVQQRIDYINHNVVDKWGKYCLDNWLSEHHEAIDAPEKKVKRLCDTAAWYILMGNSDDVVTPYKAKKHIANEVPLSFVLDGESA